MDNEKLKKATDLNKEIDKLKEKLNAIERLIADDRTAVVTNYDLRIFITKTQKNMILAVAKMETIDELEKLQAEFDEL